MRILIIKRAQYHKSLLFLHAISPSTALQFLPLVISQIYIQFIFLEGYESYASFKQNSHVTTNIKHNANNYSIIWYTRYYTQHSENPSLYAVLLLRGSPLMRMYRFGWDLNILINLAKAWILIIKLRMRVIASRIPETHFQPVFTFHARKLWIARVVRMRFKYRYKCRIRTRLSIIIRRHDITIGTTEIHFQLYGSLFTSKIRKTQRMIPVYLDANNSRCA